MLHRTACSQLLDSEKPFLRVFGGERAKTPPFWFMRQAGRYLPEYREIRAKAGNFLELCLKPESATEITLQPIKRYGMDAAIVFSDILLIPFALGQSVKFSEDRGPVLGKFRNLVELYEFDVKKFRRRLEPVYKALRMIASKLDRDKALIGFAGAPWTVATYMIEEGTSRDFTRTKEIAFSGANDFSNLVKVLVEATVMYLDSQIQAGVHAVQLFDSWAGVLAEPYFRDWVISPTREIVRRLNEKHPEVPIIGFPRGAGPLYADFVRETGVDGINLDTSVPISWATREIQPYCVVQGNLDPVALVVGGEIMRREAQRILLGFNEGPFVFNLGHGIIPQTPPEHVAELAKFLRNWSA